MSKQKKKKPRKKHATRQQTIQSFVFLNKLDREILCDAQDDLLACFLWATHITENFGKERLERMLGEIKEMADTIRRGIVTYAELEEAVQDESRIDMNLPEAEKRAKGHDRAYQIRNMAVIHVSDLWMWALHEKFGFAKERLSRNYETAARLSQAVSDGKATYMEYRAKVDALGIKYKTRIAL